ncbi:hypothetical protein DFJ77DRAFT_438560 [Powellomyces hirtus]|nr:hypothetical protein DFJ77DRAFT_438560 [Powellomyces hirtus]
MRTGWGSIEGIWKSNVPFTSLETLANDRPLTWATVGSTCFMSTDGLLRTRTALNIEVLMALSYPAEFALSLLPLPLTVDANDRFFESGSDIAGAHIWTTSMICIIQKRKEDSTDPMWSVVDPACNVEQCHEVCKKPISFGERSKNGTEIYTCTLVNLGVVRCASIIKTHNYPHTVLMLANAAIVNVLSLAKLSPCEVVASIHLDIFALARLAVRAKVEIIRLSGPPTFAQQRRRLQ